MDGILIPGHSASSFRRKPSSASFVSAASLLRECPRSLLSALAPKHPDRNTWLSSFQEEKDGLKSQDTYDVLTLEQYRAYRAKGAPWAIPTMCVLTIKPDEMLRPHCAKSCIVVLGNHEDCIWTKSEKYAPVLCRDTLRLLVSMAIQKRPTLKQGDCKNSFFQGVLPPDEITIVKPPSEIPTLRKINFGCSNVRCMACAVAQSTGMTKSARSSSVSASNKMHTICASSAAMSSTPRILLTLPCLPP